MSLFQMTAAEGLPVRLPAKLRREVRTVTEFTGAPTLTACEGAQNLSPRRAPALASRRPRGRLVDPMGSGTPHGVAVFNGGLYFARGTTLYGWVGGTVTTVGTVSDTDKQFAVLGDRLFIFPDKLYLDAGGTALRAMALDSGVIDKPTFKGNVVTLPTGYTWSGLGFEVGDCLRVVNADNNLPAPEGYYRILSVMGREAVVNGSFPTSYESLARFRRVIPDLERVCVNGNRLYGVTGKNIYVSAAGHAMDFYGPELGDGRGPAIMRLDSEGEITACAAWQGYVVFFKSDRVGKLLGTRSDSFTVQECPGVGMTARLANTLCEVGGDLYYLAENGVYRYRGREPERISPVGEAGVLGGCGGTDGAAYYLSLRTSAGWKQYCYLPGDGWYPEDSLQACGMACRDGFVCIQGADGVIWKTASDGRASGCATDETKGGPPMRTAIILPPDYDLQPEGCRLVGVVLRVTGGVSSAMEVFADYADGAAGKDADGSHRVSVGLFAGNVTDRLIRLPIQPHPCDGVRLRLAMSGDWVVHAVTREYEVART